MKAGRLTETPAMTWSAAQYVKFEQERTRPVRDLVQRIPLAEIATAADIGCGPGNSTEVLRERYPQARIIGLDSSPDMIKAARERLPDIAFEVADIREWLPKAPLDVIVANAVLQWIPDHETLLPALIAKLNPGGALAVQMPDNLDEPSHRLMREVASDRLGRRNLRTPPRRALSAKAPRPISACCAPIRPMSTSGAQLTFTRWPARAPSSNG
jgi:trans-aconitate methyltransferase